MDDRPIGIFDSGVGGLTVARAVMDRLPSENIIYLGDTERCPYGPRSLDEVRGFVLEITHYLEALGVKLIVVACNTGAAAGLASAQERFDIPMLGVIEPGAHGAILSIKNRRVGVIATEGTITSGAYQSALQSFDAGVAIEAKACPPFVEYVERGEVEGPEVTSVVDEYLTPLRERSVDTVILGCTHYPLLAGTISEVLGDSVEIISSASETAIEVEGSLARRGQLRKSGQDSIRRFLCTAEPETFLKHGTKFLGETISEVEHVRIDGHDIVAAHLKTVSPGASGL